MCFNCIRGSARLLLHVFNGGHALIGLAMLGYGAYMEFKYSSMFSQLVMIVGAFVFLSGLIGIYAVKKEKNCLLSLYGFAMALLFIANLVLLIMSYTNFNTLLGNVDDKTKNWATDNKDMAQYLLMGLVVTEAVCCSLGLLYRKWEEEEEGGDDLGRKYQNIGDENDDVSMQKSTKGFGVSSEKSEKAKKRAEMRAKYDL